jgi:hypothetical protein
LCLNVNHLKHAADDFFDTLLKREGAPLKHFQLGHPRRSEGFVPLGNLSLTRALTACVHLTKLQLNGVDQVAGVACDVVVHLPGLLDLYLIDTQATSREDHALFAESLPLCRRLRKLYLADTSLHEAALVSLAHFLQQAHLNLFVLRQAQRTSWGRTERYVYHPLAFAIRDMSEVEHWEVANVNLNARDGFLLADVLPTLRRLGEFKIAGSPLGFSAAHEILSKLRGNVAPRVTFRACNDDPAASHFSPYARIALCEANRGRLPLVV